MTLALAVMMASLARVGLVLAAVATAELSCKDYDGTSVDWWSGYKMPDDVSNLTNSGYVLASWNGKGVKSDEWWWQEIGNDYEEVGNTSVYHTTTQLPYMNGTGNRGYLVYNDQWCKCPAGEICFVARIYGKYCPVAYNYTNPKYPNDTPRPKCSCNYQPCLKEPCSYDATDYPNTDKDPDGKKFGHAKGFLIFDGDQGLWMQHSVPGFPISAEVYAFYGWGWYKLQYGQHFHCMTLTPEGIEAVAKLLQYSYVMPQADSYGIPEPLRAQYPTMAAIMDGMAARGAYPSSHGAASTELRTKGGVEVIAFGKTGDDGDRWGAPHPEAVYETNLWEDVVAPTLDASLYVETWCVCNFDKNLTRKHEFCHNSSASGSQCGPGGCICETEKPGNDDAYCCQKSACDAEFKVQQIERLDWHGRVVKNRTVDSIRTHAKWALSQDPSRPWVCFGDINRQYSQRRRGGGAACMKEPNAWRMLDRLHLDAPAAQVDACAPP